VRIQIVDTYYDAFLSEHYAARPELEDEPYEAQLRALIERTFGTSDFYSRHLRALGHETEDLVVNCEPLQRRWAAEHAGAGMRARLAARSLAGRSATGSLHSIAWAQIESFDPDVLYLQDLNFLSRAELDRAREAGINVVGQIASPPPPDEVLGGFDLILTSFPHYVERFRALGVRSEYLKIAFDGAVLDRLRARGVEPTPVSPRGHDVSFVGGIDPRGHPQRVELLERVCEVADVSIWGYGAEALSPSSPLLSRFRGPAWGLDMYEVLADSKIVINRHIDAAEGYANNMRLYESTGTGAMLLTDDGSNLGELFEPGREVVSFADAEDLVAKARHYLEHDDERLRIAAAGQARTLAEHSYERRMTELAEILER
jgi:hypothetical protein